MADADAPQTDLDAMLAGLRPTLNDGAWRFVASADQPDLSVALMAFREAEGWTAIEPCAPEHAEAHAWITLGVWSSLEAVGLTAAVSAALAAADAPANVVAAFRHDHIFTPIDKVDRAMAALTALQTAGPRRTLS